MSTDDYILLVYKNLKGELTSDEFEQLNTLSASGEEWATIRMDIEDAWDSTGSTATLASPLDIEKAYTKLNTKISPKKKPSRIISIVLGLAASLVAIIAVFNILKSGDTIYNSASGDKTFTLADNSKVWLREGSTLKIKEFSSNKRSVYLKGEAFFSVTNDQNKPYTVETKDLSVTVLGTEFLVKEKADSSITFVNVREGRVSVNNDSQERILNAGMATKFRDGQFVPAPPLPNLSSWQSGIFEYNKTSIASACRELSLVFNQKIKINDSSMLLCEVSGLIQGRDLKTVLIRLAAQYKMTLEEVEGQYYLSGGQCK